MKRIIPFVNEITFDNTIKDITGIALEHNLKMENDDSVVGEFIISGNYIKDDVSVDEEEFEKKLDFDITLDDKYDSTKVKIDIDDFYYEIIDNKYLKVHIDVVVNNLVYKEKPVNVKEEKRDLRSVKMDIKTDDFSASEIEVKKEDDSYIVEPKDEEVLEKEDNNEKNNIKTDIFNMSEEKYVTYKVHIIRENQTINDVIDMYNVPKEELEKYNDLENIKMGTKIVVPYKIDD